MAAMATAAAAPTAPPMAARGRLSCSSVVTGGGNVWSGIYTGLAGVEVGVMAGGGDVWSGTGLAGVVVGIMVGGGAVVGVSCSAVMWRWGRL